MPKLEERTCFLMYVTSRKIIGEYTKALKPTGLTYTQYLVLTELFEQNGMSVGDLCIHLYLDSGTLTPLLKKMENKGYLTRTRCKEDERVVKIHLTEKGRALEEDIGRVTDQMNCFKALNNDQQKNLRNLLQELIQDEKG